MKNFKKYQKFVYFGLGVLVLIGLYFVLKLNNVVVYEDGFGNRVEVLEEMFEEYENM